MKTTKIMMVAVVVLGLFASGCATDVLGPADENDAARSPYWRLQGWENLKLTWASLMWTETSTEFRVQVRGSVLVRNLAYNKQVRIRYTTNQWQSFNDTSARYSQPSNFNPYADPNYSAEFWNFEGPVLVFPKAYATQSVLEAVDLNFEFAIQYTVNGQSYWDNNSGANYVLTAQKRYISN